MKVIVSHDVDHVSLREHWFRDAFILKWVVKNLLFALSGQVHASLAVRRCAALLQPALHQVPALMETDRQFGIPSTFFVGVARGLNLSYSFAAAAQMVGLIRDRGFRVGVHGIAYENESAIRTEHARFRELMADSRPFGVRNHYLRFTSVTPVLQARAGYFFDSSDHGLRAPYRAGGLVEFPVCLMDSHLLALGRNNGDDVRKRTLAILEEGERQGLPFFTVIFHDCYFSDLFPEHQAWYMWLARYLRDRYEMIDFEGAVRELEDRGL